MPSSWCRRARPGSSAVEAQSITAADGSRIPLRAGFTLQADIERDRRRLIEWLFAPVLDAVAAL